MGMGMQATEMETPLARFIREQGRLKQWVAEQIGCGPQRLSRLISGERSLTLKEAALAAQIFGVDIEELVPPVRGER